MLQVPVTHAIAIAVLVSALVGAACALGGMEWSDRACETAESKRIADETTANAKSARASLNLIGELYDNLKRQAPAVAGYQRDILFVCGGLQSVQPAGTDHDLPVSAGIGGLQAEITAAQRAEFAAVVAGDIGNCADAIPKRNSAADWFIANESGAP